MRVELLWFEGCPNHASVQASIEAMLAARGLDASLLTSIKVDENTANDLRFPGSPTIRVDGEDVEPDFRDPDSYMLSCRLFATSSGLRGQPEILWIERAIDRALSNDSAR